MTVGDTLRKTPSRGPIRTAIRHRRVVGLSLRQLGAVAVLAASTGVLQSALLLCIAQVASSLSADSANTAAALGPFDAFDASATDLVAIGFALLGVLVLAELILARQQARLFSSALARSRRRMLKIHAGASLVAQTAKERGSMTQVVSGHTQQCSIFADQMSAGLVALLNFAILIGSAVIISPLATLLVAAGVGSLLLLLRPTIRLSRRSAGHRAERQRTFSARIVERLDLLLEVRTHGVDDRSLIPLTTLSDTVADLNRRVRFFARLNSSLYRMGTLAIVLMCLAVLVRLESTELAGLIAALLLLLRSLSYGQAAQASYASLNELTPVLEDLVEEQTRLLAHPLDDGSVVPDDFGTLRFDDVSFSYVEGTDALNAVSFEIPPRSFMAIVGRSGSGKSTVVSLLLRLRRPRSGTISLDATPVEHISREWWHRQIAYVPQEPKLASGPLREAIRFHREWVSDEDIEAAARRAHVHDEIVALPHGYDTELGEGGSTVSGGQRQRIAIARALAGAPVLLVLDEPTSSLDNRSERLIASTLEALADEITIIAIAHRFDTVAGADSFIGLNDGQVTHRGDDRDPTRLRDYFDTTSRDD